jgi:hypothetical protein
MGKPRRIPIASKPSIGLLALAVLFSGFWHQRPALAEVTEVTGSAYGFFTSVGLFGGAPSDQGPTPVITLPPGGSGEPIIETDPDGASAVYGPAVIVETTGMTVTTEGTTGPEGSVTSSASLEFAADQEEQVDPFNADDLRSTCTANESGVDGSVTLNNASLVTSTDAEGEPVDTIDLPVDPPPNTTFGGTIDNVGDTFRIVLNEQVLEGDTLTVNAVHFYFGQNAAGEEVPGIAKGEAILGQSVCGVSASGAGAPAATPDTQPETTGGAGESTTTTPSGEAVVATDEGSSGSSPAPLVIGALAGAGLLTALILAARRRG